MAFHGLMLLRDEEDILAQTLDHLLTWIDALYIMDLGSTDRTWDIVQDYARREKRVVPFMHDPVIFGDNLRCILFDKYRDRFRPGDWVMRIDTDEFYHVSPPAFVKQRLCPLESAVMLQWYYFRLTKDEVRAYESGEVDIHEDRKRPIEDRRRFYQVSIYTEPRMFRYRRSMRWPHTTHHPYNAGYVARQRIPIRHYPHRDPLQMQRRFRLRAAMMRLNAAAGGHWKLEDWRKDVFDPVTAGTAPTDSALRRVGVAQMTGLDTYSVIEWKPGTPLSEVSITNHLAHGYKRLAQRIIHPLLLPILDNTRRSFDSTYKPTRITPQQNLEISVLCDSEHREIF